MPAGSEQLGPSTQRRHVFRPKRARRVIYGCIALILAVFVGGNLWLPVDGRGGWGIGSRLALGGVGAAGAYFLHRLGDVRIVADEDGVSVVNIVHRHRLDWAQIVGVRLSADDPWLVLDLSHGEALAAMGVQRSEGKLAQRQAGEFARLVNQHTRTPEP